MRSGARLLLQLVACFAFAALWETAGIPRIHVRPQYHWELARILTGVATTWAASEEKWRVAELDARASLNWEANFDADRVTVVRGLLERDPAFAHDPADPPWTLPHLQNLLKSTAVPVFTDVRVDRSVIHMPFDAYVRDVLLQNKTWYARAIPDPESRILSEKQTARLAGLFGLNWAAPLSRAWLNHGAPITQLFVGNMNVSSRMHCDLTSSAFLMAQGRKRWTLCAPEASEALQPIPHTQNVAYNAGVEPPPEDAKRWCDSVVLHPGDVLFFPSFHWHAVENLDPVTVGVDVPVIDLVGSWRRNAPLFLGTALHAGNVRAVLGSIVGRGQAARDVFMQQYMLS